MTQQTFSMKRTLENWIPRIAKVCVMILVLASSVPSIAPARAASTCRTTSPGTQSYTITLCLVDPTSGSTVSSNVTVNATVSVSVTNPRVSKLVFYVDNQYLITDYQTPFTFQLPTTRWVDGSHGLSVEALLSNGLVSSRTSITVAFNNGISQVPPNTNTFTPRQGTTPVPGQPFVVAAAGDGAGGEANAVGVTNLISSWNPNLFLYLGDVYEKGSSTEYVNWYGGDDQFYGQFRTITDPTIGNHEYEGGVAPGYFDYWDNPPNYYSVNAGGWHLISLNSNTELPEFSPGTGQYAWLQSDLQANAGTCTIVYFHHPVFSVGPQGDTPRMDQIWSLLAQYNVTMVLTGHEHSYQRWVPLDGQGNPSPTGVTQFVVGSGGHGIQGFVRSDSRLAFGASTPANSYGALKLSLNTGGAGYEFVNQQGTLLDSGSVVCGGQDDTAPPSVPANFTATPRASGTDVDLSWTASTDNVGVVGYDIYRDGSFLASSGLNLAYSDLTAEAETTYTYAVLARDAAGNASPLTPPIQVTTPPLGPIFSDDFELGDFSQWTSVTGLVVQQAEVFGGNNAARATSTGTAAYSYKQLSAEQSELYYRIRFKLINVANNTVYLMRFRTSAGISLEGLFINSNGTLGIRNDVAGQSTSSSTQVSTGAWHEVQVHVNVAGASGQTDVWFDGQQISTLSAPGNFGSTPIGRIQLGENASGRTFDVAFDDIGVGPVLLTSADTTAPDTAIDSGPPATTSSTSASFTFSSNDPGSVFTCSLDAGAFSACTIPIEFNGLADGSHTFQVSATDTAGNTDPSPASQTWTIDSTAPTVPANLTATSPSGTEVDLTWEASTDNQSVTGYSIYRDGTLVTTVAGSVNAYQDASVTPSTSYAYTIDAFDAAGNHSNPTSATNVTTLAPPSTSTIPASADAWVYANLPNNNYGTSTQLRVDASPDTLSYLIFDIPALAGPVTRATLRLYANTAQSTGYDVHAVSSTTWGEQTLTYNNAPSFDPAVAGSSGPVAAGTWTQVDITSLISGPGPVSIALTTTSSTALSLVSLDSGGADVPQLILDTAPVADSQPPSMPTNPQANAVSGTQVDLSWIASSDNVGVNGYGIYRDGTLLDSVGGSTTTYQDAAVTPGTSYSYTVDAVDAAGNRSALSVVAGVTTPSTPDTTPPSTPSNLAATPPSNSQVDLSWNASIDDTGVTGYTIYRDGAQLATVDGSTTSYQDNTVVASTGYSYTVDAYDGAGNHSAQSTAADVTTPAVPSSATIQPVADTWVSATLPSANNGASTQLRMDASPDIRSYLKFDIPALSGPVTKATLRIYANTGQLTGYDIHQTGDSSWDQMAVTYNNAPSFDPAVVGSSGPVTAGTWTQVDVTPLITGPGPVSIALTTTNSSALSLASLEAGGALIPQLVLDTAPLPDAQPPSVPANLAANPPSSAEVDLSWTASSDNVGVSGYTIYRNGTLLTTVGDTTTSYQDTTVSASTAYSYTVDAFDAAGNRSSSVHGSERNDSGRPGRRVPKRAGERGGERTQ